MKTLGKIQLGKQGVTENFISSLKNCFNTHGNMKISVLRSCCRDKKDLEKIKEEKKCCHERKLAMAERVSPIFPI